MARKIKTIYFDFDGVVAISKPGGQSIIDSISIVLKLPANKVKQAFKGCGLPFLLGKQSIDDFLTNFSINLGKTINRKQLNQAYAMVSINKPLIEIIRKLKKQYAVELVTNNTVYRFKILKDKGIIDIWKEFDKLHISSQLKVGKKDFFHKVCDLGNGLFIDNNPDFLALVTKRGGNTLFYDVIKHNINYFKRKLESKLE